MVNRTVSILTLVATAALTFACSSERQTTVLIPTTPSATGRTSTSASSAPSLLGTWHPVTGGTVGAQMTLPGSLSECSNLQLNVTSQTATQASGVLTMDCPNGVRISGNITGLLGNTVVPVTWTGAATQGSESCAFNMTGTLTPIDPTSYRFQFTGTSCFGPIGGTETLRVGGSGGGGGSTPPPTSSTASDMIPLSSAIIRNSPADLARWPITSAIRVVDMTPNGIHLEFSKQDGPGRWPDVVPPGWEGPIQYSMGMVLLINGQLYASAPVQLWYGLAGSGGPPSLYAANWFYDAGRWAPMTFHQPAPGETIGIFAMAGNGRNVLDGSQSPVKERTNVVAVTMPTDAGAHFVF